MSAYILVVDDEPGVAGLVCQKLPRDQRRGRLQVNPSLILSDVNMPGMSGLDMRPAVRARRPGLPATMITACGGAKTHRKAPARGAKRRPTKRNDFSVLRPQIKTRLGQA